jgi:carbon monoxide dehydrogenase subunit G
MPEAVCTIDIAAPLDRVWRFVENMDNWGPLLTGYQRHQKLDDRESIWFVKGELGGVTRVAEFRASITEWVEFSSIAFDLTGLQEPVTGSGRFTAISIQHDASNDKLPAAVEPGWLRRIVNRLIRRLLRRIVAEQTHDKHRAAGAKQTRVNFSLQLHAGGAAGPVLNIFLGPILPPVAQDLLTSVAAAIEREPSS